MSPSAMNDVQAAVPEKGATVGILIVDTLGQLCPVPVLRASHAIKQLKTGDEMEVWATDPGSKSDFAAWTRMTGNELLTVSQEDLNEMPKVASGAGGEQRLNRRVRAYKFRIRKLR